MFLFPLTALSRSRQRKTFLAQGLYQLKIQAKDTDGKSLVCMMLDLEIKGPSFSEYFAS